METTLKTPERDPYLWRQAKARVGFQRHFRVYLMVNVGLWLLWAAMYFLFQDNGRGYFYPWPIWTTLGWGIGLLSHYVSVYRGSNERNQVEEEYNKLVNRQQ